jgi:predicted DNA-binding protein
MTLNIQLSPELEQQLQTAAASAGKTAEEYVCEVLEERLAGSREEQVRRNQAAIQLLRQWRSEDAAEPDPDPVPEIPALSLRDG